jgi:hypothetical protein
MFDIIRLIWSNTVCYVIEQLVSGFEVASGVYFHGRGRHEYRPELCETNRGSFGYFFRGIGLTKAILLREQL